MADEQLHDVLWDTIQRLFEKRIILDFTNHLTDRALYCLIYRDILPCPEKKLATPRSYLHWDCCDAGGDPELWLRYYATDDDRRDWADDLPGPLPSREEPPYPRNAARAAGVGAAV